MRRAAVSKNQSQRSDAAILAPTFAVLEPMLLEQTEPGGSDLSNDDREPLNLKQIVSPGYGVEYGYPLRIAITFDHAPATNSSRPAGHMV